MSDFLTLMLDCYKFNFSEFCVISQIREATTAKRVKIATYRLRWYCWAFLGYGLQSGYSGQNSDFQPL